jgi:hypothetical protein
MHRGGGMHGEMKRGGAAHRGNMHGVNRSGAHNVNRNINRNVNRNVNGHHGAYGYRGGAWAACPGWYRWALAERSPSERRSDLLERDVFKFVRIRRF